MALDDDVNDRKEVVITRAGSPFGGDRVRRYLGRWRTAQHACKARLATTWIEGPRMLIPCSVDCGDALPGHRLVVRGLRQDGYSDDSFNGEYMGHYKGKPVHPVVSLVYALIPGLSEQEQRGTLDIDMTVTLDPQPDPAVWGAELSMGSERDGKADGAETLGTFGPFVFPEETERVTATLTQITVSRSGTPPPSNITTEHLGTFEMEIASGAAHWTPA